MIEKRVKQCRIKTAPPVVAFEVETADLSDFEPLMNKDISDYILSLRKPKKRSRDMHNYMWVLCDKIARNMHDFKVWTKEDVYRMAVREVGLWHEIAVPNEATKELITDWERNGIGWFAENVFRGSESTTLRLYRGASVYDADDLYRLTNYVVEMAKEKNIETITDKELQRLKELW